MFIKRIYRIACAGIALLMMCGPLHAQLKDIDKELYKASTIPDSLKENANEVIRYEANEITVKSPGHAIYKHYRLATILNEKGDHEAAIGIGYEKKYNPVNSISIKVFNAVGVLIKKYVKSDMYDRSAIDDPAILARGQIMENGYKI
jgi:formyltetrahydrofolate synthetase